MKKEKLVIYTIIIAVIVLVKMALETGDDSLFGESEKQPSESYVENNKDEEYSYEYEYSNNYDEEIPDHSLEYSEEWTEYSDIKSTKEKEMFLSFLEPYLEETDEKEISEEPFKVEKIEKKEEIKDFYYLKLNDTQKTLYEIIKKSCVDLNKKVKFDKNDLKDVYIAQSAVASDNPEFFWLDSVLVSTMNDKVVEAEYKIPSSAKSDLNKMKQIAGEVVANSGTDKASQVKYFYDWVVDNTDYYDSANSQRITSVFLEKKSVCAGYAKAFQYLCKEAGIECLYVWGYTRNNAPHAWNMVKLNGNYYWVDTTWGDPIFAGDGDSSKNYNYFLVSDRDFLNEHIIDTTINLQENMAIKQNISFPYCSDDSLNYYRIKGCYFDSFDKTKINSYLNDMFSRGIYEGIELKFANYEDFTTFFNEYFGPTEYIFDVVKSAKRGYYGAIDVNTFYIEEANYIRISITF